MILNKPFDRNNFLLFLSNFLPEFQRDIREVRTSPGSLLQRVTQLGSSKKTEITVLEVDCDESDAHKRVGITQSAFKVLRDHGIRHALIAFHHGGGTWRFSFLTSSLSLKDGKVIKTDSNPRRYSYLLGVAAKTNTPHRYLIDKGAVDSLDELKERFSVEVVNKDFYASIAELFTELVGGERSTKRYPGLLKINGSIDQKIENQEFAVRLVGRIIFSWFLKEKKSSSGKPLIPVEILSLQALDKFPNYYQSLLEKLFFELLNKKHDVREERLKNPLFDLVPYLNGGLFMPQRNDFYIGNNGETQSSVEIPDGWFRKLFEVLELYNFTVDENTSYNADLSVDPEMLGRIFENLLAEINPETGESARKNTGSYYTPREIVDYMVDSSILEYLKNNTKIDENKLLAVISWNPDDDLHAPLDEQEKISIVESLGKLKIFDPACGSGAFPIGILQKIVFILQNVDPDGKKWLERQLEGLSSPELKKDILEKYERENYDWLRKFGVIRENIFGSDIQPIATEISKLRCFLTLVIDEEVSDEKENRGVHTLPNLDFKFVTANSLVALPQAQLTTSVALDLFENTGHIDALKNIRNQYFSAESHKRTELQNKFQELQLEMAKEVSESGNTTSKLYSLLSEWEPFSHESNPWFDSDWMFGVENFDLVIGNPPYIHFEKLGKEQREFYKSLKYETFEARGDIYTLFYEFGVNHLNANGILTYITSNKWMRAAYGKSLRKFFTQNSVPLQLLDLGAGVFESATVDTNILILTKGSAKPVKAVNVDKNHRNQNLFDYFKSESIEIEFRGDESWTILSPIEQSIKNKIEKYGTPLKDWDVKINYGIKTGLNEAFIIDKQKRDELIAEDPKSAEIIRPILRGRDIKRYGYDFAEKYLITAGFGSHLYLEERYPSVFKHLSHFEEQLKNRGQARYVASGKAVTPEDINYKGYPGMHHWLELDNNPRQHYMDDFSQPKIIYPETMRKHKGHRADSFPRFSYDDSAFFAEKTAFFMTGTDLFIILGVLNSQYSKYVIKKNVAVLDSGGFLMQKIYVENFYIPKLDSRQMTILEEFVHLLLKFESDNPMNSSIEEKIDELVFSALNFNKDEIDFIRQE